MSASNNNDQNWWGNFQFTTGQINRWDFASLDIGIQHLEKEWCIWHEHDPAFTREDSQRPLIICNDDTAQRPEKFKRFVFTQTRDTLEISPHLPDRNIVAKPINPITLMPSQEVTLFVGAMLWFTVKTKSSEEPLFEVPIRQLSDTWFGPSPRLGELCYASKTHAYLDPNALSHRAYRAIVPVTIRNENNKDALTIEKINVPVTILDLYYEPEKHQFWTNSIHLLKEAGSSHVQIKVDSVRRSQHFTSKTSTHLASARRPDQNRLILRAYDMLFS